MGDKITNTITLFDDSDTPIETQDILEGQDFDSVFFKFYKIAKEKKLKLFIASYEHLSRNIKLLKKLGNGILFSIGDFPSLSPSMIPILVSHIELERTQFGKKIKDRLRDRRKAGLEIGNPDIAKHAKGLAIQQRVRLALFDESNINAAEEIFRMKKEGTNFNAIAENLNSRGIASRRGGKYYAKSVERIHDRYVLLKDNYSKRNDLEERSKKIKNSKSVDGLKTNYEYSDQLEVNIRLPKKAAMLKIYNWKDKEPIISEPFSVQDDQQKKLSLSISKTKAFLPGLHYLSVEVDGKEIFLDKFYVAKSLLSMVG